MSRPTHKFARQRRHVPGTMNRTESAYALLLEAQKRAGEILGYQFEAVTFRLAGNQARCSYTPDFLVQRADGEIEFVDCKAGAGWTDDALVKVKVAAHQFPLFHWIGATRQRNGVFTREEF